MSGFPPSSDRAPAARRNFLVKICATQQAKQAITSPVNKPNKKPSDFKLKKDTSSLADGDGPSVLVRSHTHSPQDVAGSTGGLRPNCRESVPPAEPDARESPEEKESDRGNGRGRNDHRVNNLSIELEDPIKPHKDIDHQR